MQITEVKIRRVFENEGALKAVASVTLDNCFVVHDIKVVVSGSKSFIVMPAVKMHDGTFRDTVHPINSKFREELTLAVLAAYEVQHSVSEISK
jgi:stage V sporulation protein G